MHALVSGGRSAFHVHPLLKRLEPYVRLHKSAWHNLMLDCLLTAVFTAVVLPYCNLMCCSSFALNQRPWLAQVVMPVHPQAQVLLDSLKQNPFLPDDNSVAQVRAMGDEAARY